MELEETMWCECGTVPEDQCPYHSTRPEAQLMRDILSVFTIPEWNEEVDR